MIAMSEPILDRILHLPESQIPMFVSFLDTLPEVKSAKKDVNKRLGIARGISFPANFDDIDYGTAELFGLNS